MKANVGSFDAAARFVLGCLILGGATNGFGWWALTGLILIVSAAVHCCPIYRIFRFNTVDWEERMDLRHRR